MSDEQSTARWFFRTFGGTTRRLLEREETAMTKRGDLLALMRAHLGPSDDRVWRTTKEIGDYLARKSGEEFSKRDVLEGAKHLVAAGYLSSRRRGTHYEFLRLTLAEFEEAQARASRANEARDLVKRLRDDGVVCRLDYRKRHWVCLPASALAKLIEGGTDAQQSA